MEMRRGMAGQWAPCHARRLSEMRFELVNMPLSHVK